MFRNPTSPDSTHFLVGFFVFFIAWSTTTELMARESVEKSLVISIESPLVLQYGEVAITQQDVETHLSGLSHSQRSSLLANPEQLAGVLSNIYLAQAFVHRSQAAELLSRPELNSQIYSSLARELRSVYRAWYIDSIDLDDYTAPAREIFLTEPDRFVAPSTVDMEHVLIPVVKPEREVVAMRRILEMYEEISQSGDFETVHSALEESERERSGPVRLEAIPTADLLPQIAALLSTVEVGVLAPPVRTQFGWHLIRLVSVTEGKRLTWEQAEEQAIRLARDRHHTAAWERYLRDLQGQPYEFSEGAIAALRAKYNAVDESSQKEIGDYLFPDSSDN